MHIDEPPELDPASLRAFLSGLDDELAPYMSGEPLPPIRDPIGDKAPLRPAPLVRPSERKRTAGMTKGTEAVSFRIPHWVMTRLRAEAALAHVPYQTMVNRWLEETLRPPS